MNLEEIRTQIDQVDSQIRTLFVRRMQLADEVATVKAHTEDRIYKPDREAAIIEKQSKGIDDGIQMEYRALLRRIMEISRKYQYGRTLQLRDCFPFACKTDIGRPAAIAMIRPELYICDFCSLNQVQTAGSFEEVAALLRSGKADAGAGIIEKIGHGVSEELNNTLLKHRFHIQECHVREDETGRFKVVLFGKDLCVRETDNRVRLALVAPNHSGALGSLLSMIADYGVNLTEIHSIPYLLPEENSWNYRFFLELSMNMLQEESKALLFQLSQEAMEMQILGSYLCEGDLPQK